MYKNNHYNISHIAGFCSCSYNSEYIYDHMGMKKIGMIFLYVYKMP